MASGIVQTLALDFVAVTVFVLLGIGQLRIAGHFGCLYKSI